MKLGELKATMAAISTLSCEGLTEAEVELAVTRVNAAKQAFPQWKHEDYTAACNRLYPPPFPRHVTLPHGKPDELWGSIARLRNSNHAKDCDEYQMPKRQRTE